MSVHALVNLRLFRWSVLLIHLSVVWGFLDIPLLLHCLHRRLVIILRDPLLLLLLSWDGNWLILIVSVLWLLASRMYLLFYPCFITSSNLCLQFFGKSLLFKFFFTSWIILAQCLDVSVQRLVIVVRLSHFLNPAKTACSFLTLQIVLWLLVLEY